MHGGSRLAHFRRETTLFTIQSKNGRGYTVLPLLAVTPMSFHDLIVYSSDERQVLVVDVTSGKDSAPVQLERVRRALMSEPGSQQAKFFLRVQPNGLFLWKAGATAGTAAEFASLKSVLRDYAASMVKREETLVKDAMDIVIYAWLDDLAFGIRKPKADSDADQLLIKSGVYDQIRGGRVSGEDYE